MRFAPDGGGTATPCKIDDGEHSRSGRILRASFLSLAAQRRALISTPQMPRLMVRCAVIEGAVDLMDLPGQIDIEIEDSEVRGEV